MIKTIVRRWGLSSFLLLLLLISPAKGNERTEMIFPIFSYSKDFGSIYGLYYFRSLDDADKSLVYGSYMHANNGYRLWFGLKKYPIHPKWNLESSVSLSNWKELYYGLGNNTSIGDSQSIFTKAADIDLGLRYELSETNSIGYHLVYSNRDENQSKNDKRYFTDFSSVGIGLDYKLDSRDRSINSRVGDYFLLRYDYFPSEWYRNGDGLDSLQRLRLDYRRFIPFYDGTLAYRTYLSQVFGEAHYSQLNKLGGSFLLRGAGSGQYRDKALTSFQLEYRKPLFWNLSTALFLEWGQVGTHLAVDDLHMTKGIGLYYNFGDGASAIRLDTAFYEGNSKFYFMFNHAF